LHPGRGVYEQCDAPGVTFGEAVLAEALDLAVAARYEGWFVAAGGQAGDELVPIYMNVAVVAGGGHGVPQPAGLVGRESGGGEGGLHRLLLEQRHAERAAQDLLPLVLVGVLGGR